VPNLAPPAVPAGALAALTQPELESGRLRLRPWRPADRDVVAAAYADPAIQRWHCRSMTAAEGVKRGEALHADGWHDMHLHARLATDGRVTA
jgi:hypothetical protein